MQNHKIHYIIFSILLIVFLSGCASSQVKAARKGDLNALQEYLDNGGDINEPERGGKTLLMVAAENGQNPTIVFLLDRGAVISLKDDGGRTAFLYAVTARKESSALLLLQRGAAVNTLLPSGDSALTLAAGGEDQNMVKMLIENGAELNHQNNSGWNALTLALSRDAQRPSNLSSLTRYLTGLNADLDIQSPPVNKIAFSAASSGNNDVLIYLFGKGFNIESRNSSGETLLLAAIGAQKPQTVKMLLDKGADWNVKDSSGWSPLMKSLYVSASAGQKPDAIARLLMDHGAKPEGASAQGTATAFKAAEKGAVEILQLLLENGLNPAVRDDQNNTLIIAGVMHPSVIQLMTARGTPVNALNNQGMSALLTAAKAGAGDSLTALILAGADVNQKDRTGWSALFYTASSSDVEVSRKLIIAGISVFGTDGSGNTPLHIASEKGIPATVRLLLTAGIYVDSSNAKGETPLIVSARNSKYAVEIRDILIQAGAFVPEPAPAPVVTPTPAPVTTTPAPVTTTPAPITTTPAPVTTPPAPITTTPAPVTTPPAPVTTTPAPVTTPPAPITTTPAPVTTTPEPQPVAAAPDLSVSYGWPSINPSAVRGWNNSDKLIGTANLKIGYKDSGSWFYNEDMGIPMRGVNADRFDGTLPGGSREAKPCRAILTLPTKKGGALVAEVTAIPDSKGAVNLYFEQFQYQK